ncbi:DNA polymerase III subunit delta [Nitrincola tapanii]|uniref:DNA polymerase III subunit delta n=1 Tax=Nitrincola tapanii TaxID=1708751 RepID=A0A5A9W1L7_9GAMM|nr:DNA polymerase III subunit delta [Nitrincola tapanii]KAA0874627.1 DNA polymerase III subunit delta [Nitrincola tapanii]
MKLRAEQLANHLGRQPVQPIYLIAGDEPLLCGESADLLRRHLKAQGFSERELVHADQSSFNWEVLLQQANALSLFAERKILEVRAPSLKFSKPESQALQAYLRNPSPDSCLLLIAGRLDAGQKKSAWFSAIDASGCILEIWPPEPQQLLGWLLQRAQSLQLQLSEEAARLLSDRIEGNLLAAKQELDKLALLFPNQALGSEEILGAVSDSSRFDVFALMDAALESNTLRSERILQALRHEGVEAAIVLWAISRDLRSLIQVQQGLARGQSFDSLAQSEKLWGKRKQLVQRCLRRLPLTQLQRLLMRCAQADARIKGQEKGDVWIILSQLVWELSGQSALFVSAGEEI